MSDGSLVTEDVITCVEVVGAVVAIGCLWWWLASANVRARFSIDWPIALAVFVGVTVCQPFGVVGMPIGQVEFLQSQGRAVSDRSWVEVKLGGIPVGAYTLTSKRPGGFGFGNTAVHTDVAARIFLGPATNESGVGSMDSSVGGGADWSSLHLYRRTEGGYEFDAGSGQTPRYVKLGYGVVSKFGLCYWIIGGLSIAFVLVRWAENRSLRGSSDPVERQDRDIPPTAMA